MATYKMVLKSGETSVDFDASGEQLMILKHSSADVVLSLLTPEETPTAIPLKTFTGHDQQRWRVPAGTRLRLETTTSGAVAWVGDVPLDTEAKLL